MWVTDKIRDYWYDFWPKGNFRPRSRWNNEVESETAPTFDPMLGFPNGRKIRDPVLTREEVFDAGMQNKRRDYCAHKFAEVHRCIRDTGIFQNAVMRKCDHTRHEYAECKYEDLVLRYKEFERERRLKERQKRRIAMGLEPDPNAQTETM